MGVKLNSLLAALTVSTVGAAASGINRSGAGCISPSVTTLHARHLFPQQAIELEPLRYQVLDQVLDQVSKRYQH